MAEVKIADVIVPEVFNPYVVERTAQLSELWSSGIVANVAEIAGTRGRGGDTVTMPFWKDLTGAEEVLSDLAPLGVDKITTASDVAVLHARGKAWGVNDLAEALSGEDPMARIGDLVAAYWARRAQAQLISTLTGVFAAASMSGNVHDISGAAGALANINGGTFVDALQKLGDAKDRLAAVIMHSATEAQLAKNDLIVYETVADQPERLRTFLGKRVLVDDTMPTAAGNYTTYIFGAGAIGYADAFTPVPTETDRDSLAGSDILINRRHYFLHPRGVKWQGTPAGVSPTNTELETAGNWIRAYENKNIRMVKFVHKLAQA